MGTKAAQEHIDFMKKEQPEEYAKLMKNYKTEQDAIWEISYYTNKVMKVIKGSKVK